MAITKVTSGLISADASSIDLNIDAGTLYLDVSENRVGIGTTSPEKALHIRSTSNQLRLQDSTNDKKYDLNVDGNNFSIDDMSAGSSRFTIKDGGNVGIGDSSPENRLHVKGAANTSTTVQIESASTGYSPKILFDGIVGSLADNLLGEVGASWDTHTNKVAAIRFESGSDTTNKDDGLISFWTSDASSTLDERMRIDSGGRVMIGTSSNSGVSNNADNLIVGDNTSATEQGITLCSTLASGIRWNDGADAGLIEYIHSSNTMTFYTSGSERMRIDSSGNLQLGTTSSSQTILQFLSATNGANTIHFGDGSSADAYRGYINYNHTGDRMEFATSGSERMRIDSSGMLLVNTTSSWGGETTPHIESRGDVAGDYTGLIVSNTNDAASDSVSVNFGLARDGGLVFGNAGKITVGKEQDWTSTPSTVDSFMSFSTYLNESLTERMRIDSVGEVSIKRAGSGGSGVLKALNLNHAGTSVNDGAKISFTAGTSTEGAGIASTGQALNSADLRFYAGGNTERMRIDSSGRMFLGTTSQIIGTHNHKLGVVAAGVETPISTDVNETVDRYAIDFHNPNGRVGNVLTNGTSTSFNTSSDARLKDVTGYARGLEVINKLNPVSYNWKVDGKADEGLIAQEVLDIVPNAISGSEEEQYYMDYSKLVVHLVKGMKEQQAQIEALQSEINLLKGE